MCHRVSSCTHVPESNFKYNLNVCVRASSCSCIHTHLHSCILQTRYAHALHDSVLPMNLGNTHTAVCKICRHFLAMHMGPMGIYDLGFCFTDWTFPPPPPHTRPNPRDGPQADPNPELHHTTPGVVRSRMIIPKTPCTSRRVLLLEL